jgi:hypothetical protein
MDFNNCKWRTQRDIDYFPQHAGLAQGRQPSRKILTQWTHGVCRESSCVATIKANLERRQAVLRTARRSLVGPTVFRHGAKHFIQGFRRRYIESKSCLRISNSPSRSASAWVYRVLSLIRGSTPELRNSVDHCTVRVNGCVWETLPDGDVAVRVTITV